MSEAAREIADAVLYEGHVLWPYRRSSIKNQQRWTFGGVYPAAYARSSSDRSAVQVECLLEGDEPSVDAQVRFLQVVQRQAARGDALEPVDELAGYLSWDEATERTIGFRDLRAGASLVVPIDVPAGRDVEPVHGGALVRRWQRLNGSLHASLEAGNGGVYRVGVRVANTSDWLGLERDDAIRRALLSAHVVLTARHGRFVSSTDPPQRLEAMVARLENDGLWPVLVGGEGERSTMLASPIILPDYPRVAPESPGDFFDGGEIDQLLVLNILALTDQEKLEMRAGDPRAREILERTEAMTPAQMMKLHGVIRELRPVRP